MMGRVEISTIFAVSGLVLLFILSSFVSPEKIYLEDLEKHEGDVVLAEGTIVDIDITSGGNTIMTLVDESGEGKIFAYGEKDVFVGDRVEVVGRVQRYREEFEIVADKISKLESRVVEVKIWQIAKNPKKYLNSYVNVSGYVRKLEEDFMEIEDNDHRIRVTDPLIGNRNISKGDKIWLKGKFLYNPNKLSYYILSVEVERID